MIILFLFFTITAQKDIDSLKSLYEHNPGLNTALELNRTYLKNKDFKEAETLMRTVEKKSSKKEQPAVQLTIADNYFFAGDLINAHKQYLQLVASWPGSEIANDALERLYMIEQMKKEPEILKSFAYAHYLIYIRDFKLAEDSLKKLLNSPFSSYAYYLLASLYAQQNKLAMALGTLEELNKKFPDHKIYNAVILEAALFLKANKKKQARALLEELLINKPNSIYAVRARTLLKTHFNNH